VRNAELKELRPQTAAHIDVQVCVRAADYPDLGVADGDTLTRIRWVFDGGAFDGQPVLETLWIYLQEVSDLLEEAERKLTA
jgi:hypothetical protein